jgi:Ca2+-binding EF-hand superfamily protein
MSQPRKSEPPSTRKSGHEERKEVQALFAQADSDNDQRINFIEFQELLANLESDMSADEARIGFDEVDTDGNGLIDSAEFLAWWQEP